MVQHYRWTMINERLVLRIRGLQKSDAQELAESVGAEATVLAEESLPIGGYGDLGTRIVAIDVTSRALRAVARCLADRSQSHDETVSVTVELDEPDGTRREETLTYRAAAGQSVVEAATAALRALPGVGEALERTLW
jgi:hypothetical protein